MMSAESGLNPVRSREHPRNGSRWTKRWFRPCYRWRVWLATLSVIIGGCGGNGALAPVQDGADLAARQPQGEVQAGDTLYSFAWRYGIDYRELAEWNGLSAPYRVRVGDRLRLSPGAAATGRSSRPVVEETAQTQAARAPAALPTPSKTVPSSVARTKESTPASEVTHAADKDTAAKPGSATVPETSVVASTAAPPKASSAREEKSWHWPARGKVVQRFNIAKPGGQGIRIALSEGVEVVAARGGKVVYVGGGLPGYGKLIIIKHSEDLLTAYGYLDRTLVKEGVKVSGGQSIATVAKSGSGDTPTLHFEIRRDGKPTDPLGYLSG